MRLLSQVLAWGLAATLPIAACGLALPVDAASAPLPGLDRALPCAGMATHIASLQICAIEDEGKIRYQITDTASGTSAALTSPKQGLGGQQKTGVDSVRVLLASTPASSVPGDSSASSTAPQDKQEGPIWVIYPSAAQPARFLMEMCSGSGCSGSIQNK